jgi:lactoylglutathione lyase
MASTEASAASDWLKQDKRRMLHAVFRVGDIQKHIDFYKLMGMKVTRQRDIPDEKYTNAFTAYGDETTNFALEMTYNYGVDSYDIGEGFGHFGIAVPDVYKAAEAIRQAAARLCESQGQSKAARQ